MPFCCFCHEVSHHKNCAGNNKTQQNDMCSQQSFESACASVQSDQSPNCTLYEEALGPWLPIKCKEKTDWTAQLSRLIIVFARHIYVILKVLSCFSSLSIHH